MNRLLLLRLKARLRDAVKPVSEAAVGGITIALLRITRLFDPDKTANFFGRAALFILEQTGWGWFARLLALPPFVWFVELGYAIVARNRPLFARFLFTKEAEDERPDSAR